MVGSSHFPKVLPHTLSTLGEHGSGGIFLVEATLLCDRAAVMANHSDRMSCIQGLLGGFFSGVAARSHRALFGVAMATDARKRQHSFGMQR